MRRDDGRNGRLRLPLRDPRPPIIHQLYAATQVRRTGSMYSYASTHISSVNCSEIASDRARQFADKIFSIKRIFQQSKSRLAESMEALARARQIGLPPEKSDLLLIVTGTADKLSRSTDIDDFERT